MVHTEPALFGDLLRRHRREAELTQEELAERASLSARVVSDLERDDNRIPQIHTVRQLADALHLSRDDRDAFTRAARRKSSLRIVANRPGQEERTEDRTNEMQHEVAPH